MRPPPKPRRRKAYIPKAVRAAVWNRHVGEAVGRAKCTVCRAADMTQLNFHCAHVVAEAHGGATTVDNLRPTCATCNASMRTTNLDEFRRRYFGPPPPPRLDALHLLATALVVGWAALYGSLP